MENQAGGGGAQVEPPEQQPLAGSAAEPPSKPGQAALVLWRSLALGLIGAMLVIGLGLASPERPVEVLERQVPTACSAGPALPPGHPPIGRLQGRPGPRAAGALPPGHPPVEGWSARSSQRAPPAPVFAAPETLDI